MTQSKHPIAYPGLLAIIVISQAVLGLSIFGWGMWHSPPGLPPWSPSAAYYFGLGMLLVSFVAMLVMAVPKEDESTAKPTQNMTDAEKALYYFTRSHEPDRS